MTDSSAKLLFLCHTLPYPPDGGVWIRSYNTLHQLSRAFSVRALCFERTGVTRHDTEEAVRHLTELAPTEVYPLPQNHAQTRRLRDHVASILTHRVFTVYKHRSAAFRRRLEDLMESSRFDLVHVDSLDLAAYLPLLKDIPVALIHHNVESQLLHRRAESEENPVIRFYLHHQARLQRREEEHWCGRVELNITVSQEDRETLSTIAPGARIQVVPNGVDVDRFRPGSSPGREGIVFVGGSGWFPNRDGMSYFAQEILPRIRDRTDRYVPVVWVGGADKAFRQQFLRDHGVHMTGYVRDIRPHVHSAACYVVPLRVGGGSRLKILDAWAMGKAVVSTSMGCEGLRARDGKNILIRDHPDEFAEAVVEVLHDESLRLRLERAARATVVDNYSWIKIGEKMIRAYRSLLE